MKRRKRALSYNAICDRCGFKFKAYQLQETWDGLYVCKKDFEVRHPMDLFNPKPRESTPKWTRPEHITIDPITPLQIPII